MEEKTETIIHVEHGECPKKSNTSNVHRFARFSSKFWYVPDYACVHHFLLFSHLVIYSISLIYYLFDRRLAGLVLPIGCNVCVGGICFKISHFMFFTLFLSSDRIYVFLTWMENFGSKGGVSLYRWNEERRITGLPSRSIDYLAIFKSVSTLGFAGPFKDT